MGRIYCEREPGQLLSWAATHVTAARCIQVYINCFERFESYASQEQDEYQT